MLSALTGSLLQIIGFIFGFIVASIMIVTGRISKLFNPNYLSFK